MYFQNCKQININSLINNKYTYLAHINEDNSRKETLEEHINLCQKYFYKIVKDKKLYISIMNIEQHFIKENEVLRNLFREMIVNLILLHDIGKINPLFQQKKMKNQIIKNMNKYIPIGSKHSLLSSLIYLDYYGKVINKFKDELDKSEKRIARTFALLNAYLISRHHGELKSFKKFISDIDDESSTFCKYANILEKGIEIYDKEFEFSQKRRKTFYKSAINFIGNFNIEGSVYFYTYEKLIFSLLVCCDYYATTEFKNQTEIKDFGDINNIDKFYDVYNEGKILKSIRNYQTKRLTEEIKIDNINVLRNEMFLESEENLIKNICESIYYLEAPTGGGKSNIAINLSFKIIKNIKNTNKIFYIYPFNTLVDQNIKTLEEIFEKNDNIFSDIAVINSIVPLKKYKEESEEDEIDYNKSLLNRQFLNYPFILSTHVSLFDTMFGNSRESAFGFYQLANSVIVLDEIQCYKNFIWTEIITFLYYFSKILNLKVIIMSATLPNLNDLLQGDIKSINLIQNRDKYFKNNLFKNRVNIKYDLLNQDIDLDILYKHLKNIHNYNKDKKIVVEFIKKSSAYDFYNKLKNSGEFLVDIELMTGDDNMAQRDKIIKITKDKEIKSMILIATQVIEAGVDIDMDIGYKDISILDSEEQFMGRINRSCLRSGVLYFFNLDKSTSIYKNDFRNNKSFTLEMEKNRKILEDKNFDVYYNDILEQIIKTNEELNSNNLNEFFTQKVAYLDTYEINKRMKLIEENLIEVSIFLSRTIQLENGEIVDGSEIWKEYKSLLKDNNIDYAKKRVKLQDIKSKMNYFIYKVNKKNIPIYNDKIGEIYFIKDGDEYFINGKLNREKLIDNIGEFI